MIPIPDLLNREPFLGIDGKALSDLLGLAILGREIGTEFHDLMAEAEVTPVATWRPEFFEDDLFVERLIEESFELRIDGVHYPINERFLRRALTATPTDLETTRFRQEVLRELDEDERVLASAERLYRELFGLLSLHRMPRYHSVLDTASHNLDILKQSRLVIDLMHDLFGTARSGLRRLYDGAVAIRETEEYKTLAALLDYESRLAELNLDITLGGDGRIRGLEVRSLEECRDNPFWTRPIKRLWSRVRLGIGGHSMSNRELLNRVVERVYVSLSPALIPLVQMLGQLELYLAARALRDRAAERGLTMCIPEFRPDHAGGAALECEDLFNPLLLSQEQAPVPTSVRTVGSVPITVVTGPNSGGKTRLIQAIALTQLLGQSGLYAPCSRARLRVQQGLFVSLIERESADQVEGRLGRELVRIRTLFEEMEHGSMVVLDELCSGTNPSEGIEVFTLVLQLLRRVEPVAYVTTHFLDHARALQENHTELGLEFLQVQLDDERRSTYQFAGGVARTSLAALTAERLGVTFENLSAAVDGRQAKAG